MENEPMLAELRRLNESVSELVTVVRVTAYPAIKSMILSEFGDSDTDKSASRLKRQIYSLSDGKNSSREIEKALGAAVKFQTVARYQQQWRKQGLAIALGGQGKTKAVFDLEDFGLDANLPIAKAVPEVQAAAAAGLEKADAGRE
jgi:hypothetical protein